MSLLGKTLKSTYKSLLRFVDDDPIIVTQASGDGVQLEDGEGIGLPLYLNTDALGIGAKSSIKGLETAENYNLKVGGTSNFVGVATFDDDSVFSGGASIAGDIIPTPTNAIVLGSADLTFADLYLGDGSNIKFGEDQDVVLTHIADSGLRLLTDNALQFRDANSAIHSPSSNKLTLAATTELILNTASLDINAPATDISGTLNVSGAVTMGSTLTVAGLSTLNGVVNLGGGGDDQINIGVAETDEITFGGDIHSHITPNSDNAFDLGSLDKSWRKIWAQDLDISGSATLASADINAGDISGVTISSGLTWSAAQTFANISGGDAAFDAVGIGKPSPQAPLHINSAGTSPQLLITDSDTGSESTDGYYIHQECDDTFHYNQEGDSSGKMFWGTSGSPAKSCIQRIRCLFSSRFLTLVLIN